MTIKETTVQVGACKLSINLQRCLIEKQKLVTQKIFKTKMAFASAWIQLQKPFFKALKATYLLIAAGVTALRSTMLFKYSSMLL
jgi:predicted small secreted protein